MNIMILSDPYAIASEVMYSVIDIILNYGGMWLLMYVLYILVYTYKYISERVFAGPTNQKKLLRQVANAPVFLRM